MLLFAREDVAGFDFQGLRIYDFTPGSNEAASVAVIEVPPGAAHQTARSTRSDKFYFCLSGRVAFEVAGQPVTLQPEALLVIPRQAWFAYRNSGAEPARLLLVHVPPFELSAEEFRAES